MPLDLDVKRELLSRLKRIEGQARGVQRMVEEERDCTEIASQLASMRAATQSASVFLLKNYARLCRVRASDDPGAAKRLDELIEWMAKATG
jgi:DNA-binding FrmR family transcriptional regulator